jgi:2-iminoacetate synthase
MFYDEIKKYDWDSTTQSIIAKTDDDVRRALGKQRCDINDFMALISPAAEKYLEQMARLSRKLTRERFGKTISMFIPVYISNSCANSCVYCGFHVQNKMKRTVLNEEQIIAEYEAIKRIGPFDSILVLTGENPKVASVEYIGRALELAKPYFNNLQVEVMPLSTDDYSFLRDKGLNGVVCFQETYNEKNYKNYHPCGPKSDYKWRVNGYDRMGMAGVHKIGMGVLIGLEDWRTDATMLARHLRYMEKTYWRTQYSVNFPRMRCAENGGFQPNTVMSDRELAQLTFAMRIFDHDVDISYSTRETATVRDNMATLGVTTMSAESHTEPGGYANPRQSLAQFETSDNRTAREVAAALQAIGMEPVWKNWDRSFDFKK